MGDPLSAEPLRIHHVVSDIHRQDAGPSYSVPRLAEALSAHGAKVLLHALEPPPKHDPQVDTTYYRRSRLVPSLGISGAMRRGLRSAARQADVMHFHGLWMMPNVYPGWAVRGTDCVLAMSPRGMLEPWTLDWSRAKKRVFGAAFQGRVLKRVDLFHATSQQEAGSIRAAGFSAPIAVVPIGIDIPDVVRHAMDPTESRMALYLGRIHPKKNIPALIEAWDAVARDHPNWTLIIGGPGEAAYLTEIDRLVSQADRVELRGPAYGAEKTELLSAADLFILPSHSENFGVVVAEALAHGVPVVATTGTPWQGLESNSCGWWIEPSIEGICAALNDAMGRDDETLTRMGQSGRTWMQNDFSWDAVARNTMSAYEWIRSGGCAPPNVRLN